MNHKSSIENFKRLVLKAALKISKNEVPKMSLADNTFFPIVFMRTLAIKFNNNHRLKNSFPRAYLLNGIFDYANSINDEQTINKLEKTLDPLVVELKSSSRINFIDQVSMGLVLLKLYEINNRDDYRNACTLLINHLIESIDSQYQIILYRKNEKFHYVDVIGMICPFLLKYAEIFNREDLIELSNKQLEFYIERGLSKSRFPFHGMELSNHMPIGSSNWGRGLGWYMLGLSATIAYTDVKSNKKYHYFKNELDLLVKNLELCQKDHYWGQFLGITKKWHVDTSSSCMIFYSLKLAGIEMDNLKFYDFIKTKTLKNGFVYYTSGDTEDINLYSREYGKSELTQGLLLSIYSTEKNN
tara:strand:+ start:974 stop:2041 length:1068 start_codon:yes stop_codon:yes gene_type:complete